MSFRKAFAALCIITGCVDSSSTRLLPTEVSFARPAPTPPPFATSIDLGLGDGSVANGVNDLGQIVGTSRGLNAFIWEGGEARSLGSVTGMVNSWAEDINANGQVAGYYRTATGDHAFVWTSGTGIQPLSGSLGGCCSRARRINDNGLVVGEASLPGESLWHPVVWEGGVMRDIQGSHPSAVYPWGLSNSGVVVGQLDGSVEGAFSWTDGTGIVQLSGLGGPDDIALDVNSAGQVAGWARPSGATVSTAFLWQNGITTLLGTLGGNWSVAIAINEAGQIVGRSSIATRKAVNPSYHAFYWSSATGIRDLGAPDSRKQAEALALNANGWIVGLSFTNSGASRATLWRRQ